ncbi:MAG TPA: ComF family protein [Terriglobales bacterium]|nr:ComF family protein [Terriglobales bacterium]
MRRVVFSSTGDLTRADGVDDPRRGSHIASILADVAASVFATVFPSNCRFCGAPLLKVSRLPVCDACIGAIQRLEGDRCPICGDRLLSFSGKAASACCGECLKEEPPFTKAVAYGSYDGALRDLIHFLKYDRVKPTASLLGRMVGELLAELGSQFKLDLPLIVPVPLHGSKLRERGFNQSELIAAAALKVAPVGQLCAGVLERRRATESQTGLTPQQRKANIRGAFKVRRPVEVSGKDIIVVDDVFTTGTTASECARVLLRAGASRVWVVTVARVLLRERIGAPLEGLEPAVAGAGQAFARAARA